MADITWPTDNPWLTYGTLAGPGPSTFQIECWIGYDKVNSSQGYHLYKWYQVVRRRGTGFLTSNLQVSWNSGATYTVNGGVGDVYASSGAVELGWYKPGQSIAISENAGYQGGSGSVYRSSLNTTFTTPAYPSWVNPTTYKIQYNANGGSGAPSSQDKADGVNITLSTSTPTRSYHHFAYWCTTSNGTGTRYNPGDTFSANANTTLYAIWTPFTHTIQFNANGGSGSVPANITKGVSKITIPSVTPTKPGYAFLGWSNSSTATSAIWYPGTEYSVIQDGGTVTLYAVYGSLANVRTKINGSWRTGEAYIKVNGVWKKAEKVYIKANGSWKPSL